MCRGKPCSDCGKQRGCSILAHPAEQYYRWIESQIIDIAEGEWAAAREIWERQNQLDQLTSAQIEKKARAEEYYAWVDSQVVDLTEDEVKALAETPTSGGV